MFTGLIEEVGSVIAVRASDRGAQLQIAAPQIAKKIRTGDSVAVNGCCLTLGSWRGDQLTFDLLEETIDRTNLKVLRPDAPVNLERDSIAAAIQRGRSVFFMAQMKHIDLEYSRAKY